MILNEALMCVYKLYELAICSLMLIGLSFKAETNR